MAAPHLAFHYDDEKEMMVVDMSTRSEEEGLVLPTPSAHSIVENPTELLDRRESFASMISGMFCVVKLTFITLYSSVVEFFTSLC